MVFDQTQASASAKDISPTTLRGFIWLGSDAAPNLVDSAGQSLKPSSAAVGGSYSVTKNLVLRTALPSPEYIQSDSAGTIPEQTAIKLLASPVPFQRPGPAASNSAAPVSGSAPTIIQYWAQIEMRISDQPIVYVE